MVRAARLLSVVLIAIVGSIHGLVWIRSKGTLTPPAYHFIERWDADPETQIAQGGQLALACADLFGLELIPGISDTTGRAFLELQKKRQLKDHVTLQDVHGIGEKKAAALAPYLSIDRPCAKLVDGFEPFEPSTVR